MTKGGKSVDDFNSLTRFSYPHIVGQQCSRPFKNESDAFLLVFIEFRRRIHGLAASQFVPIDTSAGPGIIQSKSLPKVAGITCSIRAFTSCALSSGQSQINSS